jgi:hypothetical protein
VCKILFCSNARRVGTHVFLIYLKGKEPEAETKQPNYILFSDT